MAVVSDPTRPTAVVTALAAPNSPLVVSIVPDPMAGPPPDDAKQIRVYLHPEAAYAIRAIIDSGHFPFFKTFGDVAAYLIILGLILFREAQAAHSPSIETYIQAARLRFEAQQEAYHTREGAHSQRDTRDAVLGWLRRGRFDDAYLRVERGWRELDGFSHPVWRDLYLTEFSNVRLFRLVVQAAQRRGLTVPPGLVQVLGV